MTDPGLGTQRSDGSYNALHVDALSWAETASSLAVPLDGSAPFSIDAWIRFHGIPGAAAILVQPGTFAFGTMGSALFVEVSGIPIILSDPAQSWLTDEIWHYVCATFDGGTVRLYIDGKFNSGQSLFGNPPAPSTKPFTLGEGMHGLVRRVRVYNNALPAAQVLNNMFGTPAAANLVADFDFTQVPAADTGPNHYPITLRSNARLVTDHPALSLGTTGFARPFFDWAINPGGQQIDPYTIQAWIYVAPLKSAPQPGAQQAIFVNSDLESDTGIALFLKYDQSAVGYKLVSQRGSNGNTGQQLVSTGIVTAGAWTNVATSFDGFTLRLYLGGSADNSVAAPPIPLSRPESDLLIGSALQFGVPTGATTFQGYIEEIDVWSVCLSAADIRRYATARPEVAAAGLTGAYDFSHAPARNLVNGHSVGLAEGAAIAGQLSAATVSNPSDDWPEPEPGLDAETLRQIRASLFTEAFRNASEAAFQAAMAANSGNAGALRGLHERMMQNPGSLPFLSTDHRIGDERLLVFHTPERSWVGLRMPVGEISDCDWWKIRLILELLAGLLIILVGISVGASTTAKATGYIQKMLTNPTITSRLALGTQMGAADVLAMLLTFQKFGFLRPLLMILLEEAGFWTLLRVLARILSVLAGVGIANVLIMFGLIAYNFVRTYMSRPPDCDPPPVVTLVSIGFDHDPVVHANEALTVRRNFATQAAYPEWTPACAAHTDSRAAYAIAGLAGVTIAATFRVQRPGNHVFRIQAAGGGLLGRIDQEQIFFPAGDETTVTITLTHQAVANGGVRIENIDWNWQYQIDGGAWQAMQTTRHRIYVVLGQPSGPWQQAADRANQRLPWTDLLEWSCRWARGATNVEQAAALVTQRVNAGANLSYNYTAPAGASRYITNIANVEELFQCSQFLNFLSGGQGNGHQVNCTDCASIVVTFANALGCNLFARRMSDWGNPDNNGFTCNRIIAIGAQVWSTTFPDGDGYLYHEVGWRDAGLTSWVYDACLQVNMSTTPWIAPPVGTPGQAAIGEPRFPFTEIVILPAAWPMAPLEPDADTYRERLAANSAQGIPRCLPEPPTVRTRQGRRRPS